MSRTYRLRHTKLFNRQKYKVLDRISVVSPTRDQYTLLYSQVTTSYNIFDVGISLADIAEIDPKIVAFIQYNKYLIPSTTKILYTQIDKSDYNPRLIDDTLLNILSADLGLPRWVKNNTPSNRKRRYRRIRKRRLRRQQQAHLREHVMEYYGYKR